MSTLTDSDIRKALQPEADLLRLSGRKSIRSVAPVIQGENPWSQVWLNGEKPLPFSQLAGVTSGYMSWAYAAATLNARGVAGVPLRLYARKATNGRKSAWNTRPIPRKRKAWLAGEVQHAKHLQRKPSALVCRKSATFDEAWEEVEGEHPALRLLHDVNPWTNGFDFLQLLTLYLQLAGNAYWMPVIQRGTGTPSQLWPLMPQWTRIKPGTLPGDPWIKGYSYGINQADRVNFEASEIIPFKLPNPGDSIYGKGWVEGGWAAIMLNQANHAMDLAFSQNMNRPDFIASIKDAQSTDLLDRFMATMQKVNRGTGNAGKFAAVNGDVKITPLNFMPKDMNGREETVEEIAAVSGVPVTMLKASDPNKASSQTANDWWLAFTIQGYCKGIEAQLNEGYLPLFPDSENMMLAFDDPVPRDDTAARDSSIKAVAGAIMTINEARAEEELPPVEGGDEPIFLTRQGPVLLSNVGALDQANIDAVNASTAATRNPKPPPKADQAPQPQPTEAA